MAHERAQPTDEGRRRYPYTEGYYPDLSTKEDNQPNYTLPCTCTSACNQRCAGECGCAACAMAFAVFYDDIPGFFRLDGTFDEDQALLAYRTGFQGFNNRGETAE